MVREWFTDLSKLLFPTNCFSCGSSLVSAEEHICSACLLDLPQTNFYKQKENALSQKLRGRFDFEEITTLYYFNTEGIMQELLHEIKYRGNQQLAIYMGRYMAAKLNEHFKEIDLVIPVPLHINRVKERGYNQSERLAKGFSAFSNIPIVTTAVKRVKDTATQTHKSRLERLENMKQAFRWEEKVAGKHILLIDDVITTGATIESLLRAMPPAWNNKISILSLAAAIES